MAGAVDECVLHLCVTGILDVFGGGREEGAEAQVECDAPLLMGQKQSVLLPRAIFILTDKVKAMLHELRLLVAYSVCRGRFHITYLSPFLACLCTSTIDQRPVTVSHFPYDSQLVQPALASFEFRL